MVGSKPPLEGGFHDDAIVKVSPDGNVLYRKSLSQIIIDSGMESRLIMIGDRGFNFDPIHVNDIQPVSSIASFGGKEDLFLSLGHQSLVLFSRPSTGRVIWKSTGNLFYQHDVNIVDEKENIYL